MKSPDKIWADIHGEYRNYQSQYFHEEYTRTDAIWSCDNCRDSGKLVLPPHYFDNEPCPCTDSEYSIYSVTKRARK